MAHIYISVGASHTEGSARQSARTTAAPMPTGLGTASDSV
jgi:hypothetical protein